MSELEGWLLFVVIIEAFPTAMILLAMILSCSQHRQCPKCGHDGKAEDFGYEVRILGQKAKRR